MAAPHVEALLALHLLLFAPFAGAGHDDDLAPALDALETYLEELEPPSWREVVEALGDVPALDEVLRPASEDAASARSTPGSRSGGLTPGAGDRDRSSRSRPMTRARASATRATTRTRASGRAS